MPFKDSGEPDLVKALHEFVPVRLPFGEQMQEKERENALQQLGVVI